MQPGPPPAEFDASPFLPISESLDFEVSEEPRTKLWTPDKEEPSKLKEIRIEFASGADTHHEPEGFIPPSGGVRFWTIYPKEGTAYFYPEQKVHSVRVIEKEGGDDVSTESDAQSATPTSRE